MERKMVQAIPLSIYAEYFNPFTLIIRSLPAICYKDSYMTKKTGMERENSIFCQHEPDKRWSVREDPDLIVTLLRVPVIYYVNDRNVAPGVIIVRSC